MNHLLLFIFLVLYFQVNYCNKDNEDKFIATNEWKTIKKGQKVPSGLHYRINLETGATEAKLIDEKPNDRRDLLHVPAKDGKDLTVEDIKEALKNIKGEDVKSENVKSKFRSYEQLKEEMGALNLTSKVDAEIIRDLIKEHKDEFKKENIEIETIVNILEDFDYLVHQFDNGLEFVNQNGFRDIIYKNLNYTSNRIKESTLRLFGSIVQNNARVQIHALETGSVPILLRLLSSEGTTEHLKSNIVFALGCLLRRFPLAQGRFVENGGTFLILQLLEKSTLKVQLKIITLMSDLFIEKRQAKESTNQVVVSQYNLVNLEKQLINQNWCIHIDNLLVNVVNTNPEDHDSIEKVLIAMEIVCEQCKKFNKELLNNLKSKYERLAKVEFKDDDNFFKDIYTLCSNILSYKTKKNEL